jgi:hypothetical protein
VHAQATSKQKLTKLTTTQTQGSHHPPPYNILCAWPWVVHPNVTLSQDSQVRSLEIFEIGTLATLKAHNFLYRHPIEVKSKSKL